LKYLVDANILSEPTKPQPATHVVDWLRRNNHLLALSPIVLGEIELGILLLPMGRRRSRLLKWYAGANQWRTVDFDSATASEWAKLLFELRRAGKAMPIKDSLIAALALQHDLIVATRNTVDFQDAGVQIVNPFDEH
jgi:predicted nucleic acid-binding protein